ncbi:unannotated protein [freshwater metagenome]|uniref:Unannotated protein n=1 Tax=freshwater metagenome TaxID=449393 RepID=A0A6J7DXF6_9ZZZZ
MSQTPDLAVPSRRRSLTGRASVLAVVAGILIVTLAVPVRSWFDQRTEIEGLQSDVESAQERVDALTIEQERWKDPAFIAAEARRRLHFVRPGEIGYTTIGSDGKVLVEPETELVVVRSMNWFQKLWAGTERADDPSAPLGPGVVDLATPTLAPTP